MMRPRSWIRFAFIFWGLTAACVSEPQPRSHVSSEESVAPQVPAVPGSEAPAARAPERQSPGNTVSPEDLTLTQPELTLKKPRSKGPRFDLSAESADVRTVLFELSKKIGQNLIIDPDIEARVTVHLQDVTLQEVLEHVLRPQGLEFDIEDDFIRVRRRERVSRLFHLNYILSRREGAASLRAVRPAAGMQPEQGRAGSANLGVPPAGALSQVRSSEEADLWREIESGLEKLVTEGSGEESSGARPFFSINRQAGVILVRGFPAALLRVAEFLEAVEGSVQRQVFIQAKIIEVSLNEDFPLGIDWNAVAPLPGAQGHPRRFAEPSGFRVGVGDASLEEVIDALARQGDVFVLSSPKLATLNNQRAVMKAGREEVRFVSAGSLAGPGETAPQVAAPLSEGIVLDVVPQINANGTVMMSIHTSISEKTGETPGGSLSVLQVRESNNVVLARNGQTVVIGGLMKTRQQSGPEKNPGNFSLLENLFPDASTHRERSELVILLTPEIMVGAAVDDRLDEETQRLRKFNLSGRIPLGNHKP